MATDYGHDDYCGCGDGPGDYFDESGPDGDDRYDEYKDDLAMGYIHEDGSYREPNPEDHPMFERYEHERYLRSLSPIRRLIEPVRAFIWRHTWRQQDKARASWRKLTGRADDWSDEPPF